MATAPEENPYEGGAGLGTGGKFRKPSFRRSRTTPYDRPPMALRNPGRHNGWFSKLVDPAQRLITYSAHSLFSSVFRKRLPPPPHTPQDPPSSETEQEVRGSHQEESDFKQVAIGSSSQQQGAVGEGDVQINCSDGGGLTELEKLLRQKTFTRSEIDHLTALMRSRTVDSPVREEEKRTDVVPPEAMLPCEQQERCPKTPALENGIENRLVEAPYVTSNVPNEDVASPAELAKAYMGSIPFKVSSSMLGFRSPALKQDPTLPRSQNYALQSSIMPTVPRATRHAGIHENGFVTPRSRGRSALYSMARTPYTRLHPTSTLKGGGFAVEGEPSSAQSAHHDILSGSKQGALKRRSSALDNDIGSVGPIRRIRHKSTLLYSKGLGAPLSGSPLSISSRGGGIDATQKPLTSMQKPFLSDEVKHSHMKSSTENIDDTRPSMSFPPLPSKSSEMASKILQQLDKLVSPNKEKSSELRLPTVNDKSPTKLSPSMLRGQALRSMETVDSSKLLDNIRDNKLEGALGNLSASAQKLTSKTDKVENGPLKLVAPSDGLAPVVTGATIPSNQFISSAVSVDSSLTKPVSYPPQTKRGFHMSAHEDYLDLDDDAYPNGAVSSFSPVEKESTSSTAMAKKTTFGTETIPQENPPALSVVMPSRSSIMDDKADIGTADGSMVGEKVNVSTSLTSSMPDPTFKPVTSAVPGATQTIFGSNKPASPNGSIANPLLFNVGNKLVSSTESTATDASSKESSKSAPIFGLEKVSSKDPGADAPVGNFGTKKNLDKFPQMPFTSSSVGGESTLPPLGASSDSKLRSSISATTVAGATDLMPNLESDNADVNTNIDPGFSVRSSELAVSSAASTSPSSIFTFGHNSNQNNGPPASLSSSFPSLLSNNFSSQNMFSSSSLAAGSIINATAASTSNSMTASTPAIIASSNSSSSTPLVPASSSTTSFFKFGSSPVQSTGLPVSSTSVSEPVEAKSSKDAGIGNLSSTAFGSSSAAVGSIGSGIFGFSSSATTTVNSQSQGSVFGTGNGSVLGAQASPATNGFAAPTQSQSVSFGSPASAPSFGLTGSTTFSSGSSLFSSSSSSPATSIFNSGTTFGLNTSASSSAANSVSSNSGTSSTVFGQSSWPPSKSPFGSPFSSSSSSGFMFGASTASTSQSTMFSSVTTMSSPQFAFNTSAATTSTQPAFGSSNPVFQFGSASAVNNDQMSMEDTMAEDTPPATPIFGQQPAPPQPNSVATPVFVQQPSPPQPNFVFGAPTPSAGSPFQFAGQQSITPQNPPPFQASRSLDFNAGSGSFSLGTGGGDKSNRKYVRVSKNKQRKK